MRFVLILILLVAEALCLASQPAAAQYRDRVPEAQTDDIRLVAAAVLRQTHWDHPKDEAERTTRTSLITALQTSNSITQRQSTIIIDDYVLPAMKIRQPELTRRFEDVLVSDFTIDELRAIIRGAWYDPKLLIGDLTWGSASAKFPRMQADFRAAQISWIGQVLTETVAKHRSEINNVIANGDAG